MENRHGFSATCATISVSGIIISLYIFIKLLHGQLDFVFPVILMICSLLVCPLNFLFIRKERTTGIIFAFNAVIAAVFVAATILSGCLNEKFSYPYAIISIVLIVVFGANSVIKPILLTKAIICFDGSVVMLVLLCLYVNVSHFAFSNILFSIIGSFAGLLGLIAFRTSGSYGKREWGIIIFLFLVIALISWLLFTFVVSPLSSGFELAGGTIATAFTSLGLLIERFFKFLAGLFKDDTSIDGSLDIEPGPSMAGGQETEEMSYGGLQLVLLIALIVVIVAAVILAIVIFRKNKHKSGKLKKQYVYTKQTSTALKDALNILLIKIKRYFTSRKFLKSNRNRAEGVYFDLVKISKHTVFEKKEGDTAMEFLLRLKNLLAMFNFDVTCMDVLIPAVNNNFFGETVDKTEFSSATVLRRNIRKAISLYNNR